MNRDRKIEWSKQEMRKVFASILNADRADHIRDIYGVYFDIGEDPWEVLSEEDANKLEADTVEAFDEIIEELMK